MFLLFLFSTLAGAGAREWAKKNGIPVTQSENLLTGDDILILSNVVSIVRFSGKLF